MLPTVRFAAGAFVLASIATPPLPAMAHDDTAQRLVVTGAASATSSQMIVRDGATGQLRAPTAEEAQVLQTSRPALRRSAVSQPMSRSHVSGAQGARLTDEFMSYSVIVRQPDGSLAEICFSSREEAEAALEAKPVAKAATAPKE